MGNKKETTHTELYQIHSLTILLDWGKVSGFGTKVEGHERTQF